jgi:hypothetical protein
MVDPDKPHKQCNMMYAHCMIDNLGYRHILRISNIYCFSTATVATRTLISRWFGRVLSFFRMLTDLPLTTQAVNPRGKHVPTPVQSKSSIIFAFLRFSFDFLP